MSRATTWISEKRERAQAAWSGLQARERRWIAIAAAVVGVALVWTIGIAPALSTLRTAPAQRQALQLEAARIQQMQRQARALLALPQLDRNGALQALQEATKKSLGPLAQTSVAGPLVRVSLKNVPAQDLADWIADVRINAHLAPTEANLQRTGGAAADAAPRWSGSLSFNLPS